MKLQINTVILKDMLTKAIKGVGNNKLIPLTSLIALRKENGTLTITTTDITNYLYIREHLDDSTDEFYAVVDADMLYKLIAKMTCDKITLSIDDSALFVTGNGSYKIEIPLDEDGEMVKYPNPANMVSLTNLIGTMTPSLVSTVLNSIKPALMTTQEYPCYTNYFCGDCVVATDTYKISLLNKNVFNHDVLVSAEAMNLLDLISDDTIQVYLDDNKLLFCSEHVTIYSTETQSASEFSVDTLKNLANSTFANVCKVSKNELLQILDRIALFVGAYDNGEIMLDFGADNLTISSKLSNGVESLRYTEHADNTAFTCSINVTRLMSQIKAQREDIVTIMYGDESAIKLIDNDIISVVALMD